MLQTPLAIAARNAHDTGQRARCGAEIWEADIVIARDGVMRRTFDKVLFAERAVEGGTIAFIFGIETEDGAPDTAGTTLPENAINAQREVIQFLRAQTAIERGMMGIAVALCLGIDYTAEAQATAAYIIQRDRPLDIAVGYRSPEGQYERLWIQDDDAGFIEDARATLKFTDLARPAARHDGH